MRERSEHHVEHWVRWRFGLWTAELRDAGPPVGWIGASHPDFVDGLSGEVEIGWTLRAEFRGRGLATEGARSAVAAAFAHLDVQRVISLIDPANAPSMAVAPRLGMRRERDVLHATSGTPIGVWMLTAPG